MLFGGIAAVVHAATAHATTFPPTGGPGDFSEEYRCPFGQVLVGFHGGTREWTYQIGLICAPFVQPSYTAGAQTRLPARGGKGGGSNEQICDPDAAIRNATFGLIGHRYGLYGARFDYLGNIKFSCFRPRDGSFAGGRIFGGTAAVDPDLAERGAPTIVFQQCPGSEYATGLTLRYGKHVNAAGLICSAFEATTATPPSSAGPAPAGTEYHSLGKKTAAVSVPAGSENNTDRAGSDYTNFAAAAPATCELACTKQSDRCRAWTWVRPGVQGSEARCYLKSAAPAPRANSCCVSGMPTSLTTGAFDTDFGQMALGTDDGTYGHQNGRVKVRSAHDNIVEGTWEQGSSGTQCPDGRYRGKFVFAFTQDGFTGSYGYCDDAPTAGKWNGTRR